MSLWDLFVDGLIVVHNPAINDVPIMFVDASTPSTKDCWQQQGGGESRESKVVLSEVVETRNVFLSPGWLVEPQNVPSFSVGSVMVPEDEQAPETGGTGKAVDCLEDAGLLEGFIVGVADDDDSGKEATTLVLAPVVSWGNAGMVAVAVAVKGVAAAACR